MRARNEKRADLQVINLTRRYGSVLAVDDVSLSVRHGEIVAILGPSGSGKSTLLSMVGGQLNPDSGDIRIGGTSILGLAPNQRATATVFQDYALFPHLTVGENIAFGLRMHRWPKESMVKQVRRMLDLVGLAGYENRAITQLSGGQRQRVATVRALAVEPSVLLLDEPLGALDRQIRQHLQKELSHLLRQLSVTALLVTHDQQEAFSMADRVAVMHQGRLQQIGEPTVLYATPETEFVATFLGEGTLLDGEVLEKYDDEVFVEANNGRFKCRGQAKVGTRVRVLIRPEQIILEPSGSRPDATWDDLTVSEVVHGGETTDFTIEDSKLRLRALVLGPGGFNQGDKVSCFLKSDGPVIVPNK